MNLKPGEPKPAPLSAKQVRTNDDARESQVKALLDTGALQTAHDFYRAALIFQHAQTADGQLLAHVLADISAAKGYVSARWLSAASLDRYLVTIGQKQIFGTQFKSIPSTTKPGAYDFEQSPINEQVLSDALRAGLCVKPVSEQKTGLPGPPAGTGLKPCTGG